MGERGERIVMLRRKKYDEEGEKGVQDRKVGLLWCGDGDWIAAHLHTC